MKKEVLVVFKTHLDIGYTALAKEVIEKYIGTYIPRAIKVARELMGSDTPFVWTLGSWMVAEALKHDADGTVEAAVRDGLISWHGLPFTSHTELMSEGLFKYGLSVSGGLDERFGRKTVGAKMTDVPGHTVAMVPHLYDAGIRFLHIGVNAASPLPPVPRVFRWMHKGKDIVVMYDDGYGHEADFGEFAVVFAHTNDNLGPQSAREIVSIYEKIAKRYPDAHIKAADLNDVAEHMLRLGDLPVIESEIGDSWIHGAGTDPKKIGMYRELLRVVEERGFTCDLTDTLLLVPEHTCGLSGQSAFPNREDWLAHEIDRDELREDRRQIELSWQEQRDYVTEAARRLSVDVDYTLTAPDLSGLERCESEPNFEISWQLFDRSDITRYIEKYMTVNAENMVWAGWDYTKPGLPDYEGGILVPRLIGAYKKGEGVLYRFDFSEDIKSLYTLPTFYVTECGDELEIDMIGKGNLRMPHAFWLKFKGFCESWQVEKMGSMIDPASSVGSPYIMAADRFVECPSARIYPIDSCLVAPFGRRLYDYDVPPVGEEDMYFNLYNNIWSTNFPLWYGTDTRFRFKIEYK